MEKIMEKKIYKLICSRVPERLANRMKVVAKEIYTLVSEDEGKGSWELAEKIQRWIGNQDYFGEPLLHASVCCDHVGRMRFIKALSKLIKETNNEITKRMIQEYIEKGLPVKYNEGAPAGWEKGISYKYERGLLEECIDWLTQQKEEHDKS